MRNAGLEETQAGIKIARRNINNLRYSDDTTLMAESEELKSLLMKVRLMLKLKLQYIGHLMWRDDSLEKTLMLAKIEGRRRRGQQRMRWLDGWHHRLDGHGFGWTPGVGDGQGGLACCGPWGHEVSDMTEWLNWTELLHITTQYANIIKPNNFLCIWVSVREIDREGEIRMESTKFQEHILPTKVKLSPSKYLHCSDSGMSPN